MSEKMPQLNEEVIKGTIGPQGVEETLNELLEKEVESLTRHERSLRGYRSGHYDRNL